MRDGTFEAYGSRDYEYVEGEGWAPVAQEAKPVDYAQEISQLKADVHQLKTSLKAIMDLLGRHATDNHPLYQDYK